MKMTNKMAAKDYFIRVEAYPFRFGHDCFVDFDSIDEASEFCETRGIDMGNEDKVFLVTWND